MSLLNLHASIYSLCYLRVVYVSICLICNVFVICNSVICNVYPNQHFIVLVVQPLISPEVKFKALHPYFQFYRSYRVERSYSQ